MNSLLTTSEVAFILDVPLLAVGQAVFDGRLHVCEGFTFRETEVIALKADQAYLNTLR